MSQEDYSVFDILNNTLLSVLIAIISGLFINVCTNLNFCWQDGVFVFLCIVSIIVLIIAIGVNNIFEEKCHNARINSSEPLTRKAIKDIVNDHTKNRIRRKFLIMFILSLFSVFIGLFFIVLKNSQSLPFSHEEQLLYRIEILQNSIENLKTDLWKIAVEDSCFYSTKDSIL